MKIPANFAFSQNNLQDYIDCPRRFELRHLQKLAWPAVRTEPYLEVERHMLLGERFHRMLQQYRSGLTSAQIEATANEPELVQWWAAYHKHPPADLPQQQFAEFTLTAPFENYRLVAKYDLIAIEPGERFVIVDWKTNLKKSRRTQLLERMQTRLYPLLLVLAGKRLNDGNSPVPEQVEMVYWFTADPKNPEFFSYSSQQFDADRSYLQKLIAEVKAASESQFSLTTDVRMCRFCNYRSLCDRGDQAATYEEDAEPDELETITGFDIDFERINEIEF